MWFLALTLFVVIALPALGFAYGVERLRLARALATRGSKLLSATPFVFLPASRHRHGWRLLVGTVCFDVRYRGTGGIERVDRFWPVGLLGTNSGLRRVERGPRYLTPELRHPS
ncbi:MAG: hypothetical protein GC161_10905 [Planctomycetaceae bacterium]|nr:hypothetical protein [Planctomycetaceae bacterium]